jgi:hypothetical protein
MPPGREPRVQGAAHRVQLITAAVEVDRVVVVASVGRAAPRGDESSIAQPTEVVRDEVLWLVDEGCQLVHGAIAASQLIQESPPHRVCDELHEARGIGGARRCHAVHRTPHPVNTSI